MEKYNILFFNYQGFSYGSVEKLMQLIAKHVCGDFTIFYAYSPKGGTSQKPFLEGLPIHLVPFDFGSRQQHEPYAFIGMNPPIMEMIERYHIHAVYTAVFAHYQYPINVIPASIPLVLISPFGHYATNGAVQKVYVSGRENTERVAKRAGLAAERDWHPLPDVPIQYLEKKPVGKQIIFGRLGRGEDDNFDPISVKAFKKLEEVYGDRVKYIVVNPSPAWQELAKELGIKNMEYRFKLYESELPKFYHEIDIFAHARLDGETIGMAIAEAMMAGNPIVTHKSHFHNDHFDILSTEFARWCEADDDEAYFRNMAWFVENPDKIRGMGKIARKKSLEIFSIKAQTPAFVKTFREAAERCTHYTRAGKIKGYMRLWWENCKAMPFYVGKMISYKIPRLDRVARSWYHRMH
jgi:glycosyltransferase involved in cell wall biosynthesis